MIRRNLQSILKATTVAAALLLASTAPAQKEANAGSDKIVIAVAGPFTGSSASLGKQLQYGAMAAEKDINAHGGLLGKKVSVIAMDDEGLGSTANQVAQKLSSNRDVVAVIGHFNSDCSSAAKGTYTDAGLVMFSPGSTNPTVTQGSDYVFRNIFNDRTQGYSLAEYISAKLKMKRVAVLYENDTYGKGLRDYFMERAKTSGLEVLTELSYQREATDFRPLLTQIRDADPEIILICGLYKAGGTISLQARELGLVQPLIGGDGMYAQELISIGGDATDGFICTAPFIFDEKKDAKAENLGKLVKEIGNVEADAWAVLSYDASEQVFEAIRRAGKADRKSVRDELAKMTSKETGYTGISGTTFFDKEGDTLKPVTVAIVKDGKFVKADLQLD